MGFFAIKSNPKLYTEPQSFISNSRCDLALLERLCTELGSIQSLELALPLNGFSNPPPDYCWFRAGEVTTTNPLQSLPPPSRPSFQNDPEVKLTVTFFFFISEQ